MALEAPGGAAGEQSDELRDADVALHLGVHRSAECRLDCGSFGINVGEVWLPVSGCKLRLGSDEHLGYANSVRDGDGGEARYPRRETRSTPAWLLITTH